MRQVQSDEVRRGFGKILSEVEYRDQHVQILRYDNPAAVLVPVGWYTRTMLRHALDVSMQLDRTATQKRRIVDVQNRLTSWLAFGACENGRPTAKELREAIGDAADRNIEEALSRWETEDK